MRLPRLGVELGEEVADHAIMILPLPLISHHEPPPWKAAGDTGTFAEIMQPFETVPLAPLTSRINVEV